MDTKQIGNIVELEVLTYITKLGYQVSIPFGDRERYDQIWDINGKLLKIQVKKSKPIDKDCSAISFSCRSSKRVSGKCINSRYKNNEIDYFATIWDGQCYIVPLKETSASKILRFNKPHNNQQQNISYSKDYLVEEVLKRL